MQNRLLRGRGLLRVRLRRSVRNVQCTRQRGQLHARHGSAHGDESRVRRGRNRLRRDLRWHDRRLYLPQRVLQRGHLFGGNGHR